MWLKILFLAFVGLTRVDPFSGTERWQAEPEVDFRRCQRAWAASSASAESPSRERKRPSEGSWVRVRIPLTRRLPREAAEGVRRRRRPDTSRRRRQLPRRSSLKKMSLRHPPCFNRTSNISSNSLGSIPSTLTINTCSSSSINLRPAFSNIRPSSLTLDPILVRVHSGPYSHQVRGPFRWVWCKILLRVESGKFILVNIQPIETHHLNFF